MDAREIPSDSGLIYGITGHGPGDGRDSGMVDGRVLYIDKKSSDTSLRLLYQDNFRVHLSGKACSWEIKVDGKSCSSGVIRGDRHVSGGENTHRFHAIIGYCDNIAAGKHKIQAYVAQAPGYSGSDCYTGWGGGASWTLASEEVTVPDSTDGTYDPASCQKQLAEDPTCDTEWFGIAANNGRCWCVAVGDPCTAQNKALAVHYAFEHGPQDGRDAGYVDGRSLLFKKQSASSRLLVTYNDNMRVYGHGKACRWVVKLDGSDCSTGLIAMDMHVQGENNDHSPHVLMGYCDGVAAGDHEINVTVMQSPGYSGSDCYTG